MKEESEEAGDWEQLCDEGAFETDHTLHFGASPLSSQGHSAVLIRISILFIVLSQVPAPVRTLSCSQRRSGLPLCLHFCKTVAFKYLSFHYLPLTLDLGGLLRELPLSTPWSQSLSHRNGPDEGKKGEKWFRGLTGPFIPSEDNSIFGQNIPLGFRCQIIFVRRHLNAYIKSRSLVKVNPIVSSFGNVLQKRLP